ncbi:MAG: bifunctional adenosylcobinamide kinase/adenosylcobinamide-phosphate guanylyltransferase [Cohnella sp.]|nr:bifunctional adenosylcobinamide kinase/adenosylcobinamide-phosphate guanylyltransferase [Cohnella sp.]
MLWLITGGIASGKSRFAEHLAASLGREGIYLSCETFPGYAAKLPRTGQSPSFPWLHAEADATLAMKLRSINEESNLYRAERRVLVVDSLSGWLRRAMKTADKPAEAVFEEVIGELIAYQGKLIVVSEETAVCAFPEEPAVSFAYRIADANRTLSERSRATYRLTAGIAAEMKGYRVTREVNGDENIYENGR